MAWIETSQLTRENIKHECQMYETHCKCMKWTGVWINAETNG